MSNHEPGDTGALSGPQGFRRLSLRNNYNTSAHNLARDFFCPLLSSAVAYDRGVGYFSSGWLRINAQGLAELAMRGGHARWITSPLLSRGDLEAFTRAADSRIPLRCVDQLHKTVAELQAALEINTLNTMAWMIADGLLQFRIALPAGKLEGDFHDKFGVFRDTYGQRVSFLGSYNDTVRGLRNYESIRVFYSWYPNMTDAVSEDEQRFARIWLGREHNLRVFPLPEAVRKGILALRTDDRPYPEPQGYAEGCSIVSLPGILPRTYQQEAIDAWLKHGRRGIMDMATGTGKTIVALAAMTHCDDVGFIVIGVPTIPLVTQWLQSLQKLKGIHLPIEVSGNNPGWAEASLPRLRLATASSRRRRPFVFVGTYQSLSGERFLTLLGKMPLREDLGLLIADEVHHVGAPSYQQLLCPQFGYRLGLTATLERAYDKQGTQLIQDYFGGIIYRLGIEKAVGSILCQYHYDVHFAELTEDEFAEYQRLSVHIANLMGESTEQEPTPMLRGIPDRLTILLNRRARIVKRAQEKLSFLADLIRQAEPRKCLIYCADLEQVCAVQEILGNKGISHLRYTSEESLYARQTALEQLRRNDIQAVVAVKCLDEGIDVPQVHQAILLASSTSEREFVQRRGRILRRAEGKRYAHLIDAFTVPPRRYHDNPPTLLLNELRRAKILARAADNRLEVELRLDEELSQFGIAIEQTLGA